MFDDECPGLGVRVTARGSKVFLVQWTDPTSGRKIRDPIGVWGAVTLDQARIAARIRLGDVARGLDRTAERGRRRAEHDAVRADDELTLGKLVAQWRELQLVHLRPKYAAEAERAVRHAFAAHLDRSASALTRAAMLDVLDGIVAAGKTTMAGMTLAYARSCYSWAVLRGAVKSNSLRDMPRYEASIARQRVLAEAEVSAIWIAADAMPYPFGPFYKIALLTLQRREQLAAMTWSELSPDRMLWTIPGPRMKNGKPHDVHLSRPVRAILRRLPRHVATDLVFTTTGRTAISGFSKAKENLDAAMSRGGGRGTSDRAGPPEGWNLHDFRQTGVTKLAQLKIDPIVADKIIAHQPGKLKGVALIYLETLANRIDLQRAQERGVEQLSRAEVEKLVGANADRLIERAREVQAKEASDAASAARLADRAVEAGRRQEGRASRDPRAATRAPRRARHLGGHSGIGSSRGARGRGRGRGCARSGRASGPAASTRPHPDRRAGKAPCRAGAGASRDRG